MMMTIRCRQPERTKKRGKILKKSKSESGNKVNRFWGNKKKADE